MKYEKPALEHEQHLELFRKRNLTIKDSERATKYLENIGYYRLSGYMYHLQENNDRHIFVDGTTFSDIVSHYHFDKKLRSIFIEYLERIEIALRSKLTNYYSVSHGFYWYTQYSLYDNKLTYSSINTYISDHFQNPQERFLKHFKNKYTLESLPPSNMAMELLTMGKLARLYKGLKNGEEKQKIASEFGIPTTVLSSWLIYLNNVRNICAHHSRLWNRGMTADQPTIPSRKKYKFHGEIPHNFNRTTYGAICLIDRLLHNTNSKNRFIEKVLSLMDEFSNINVSHMGFPDNWRREPAWKK